MFNILGSSPVRVWVHTTLSISLYFFKLINLFILQYCIGFAIHWLEATMGVHVFPIPNPPHFFVCVCEQVHNKPSSALWNSLPLYPRAFQARDISTYLELLKYLQHPYPYAPYLTKYLYIPKFVLQFSN